MAGLLTDPFRLPADHPCSGSIDLPDSEHTPAAGELQYRQEGPFIPHYLLTTADQPTDHHG